MTLNIETERPLFETAYRVKWPAICAVNHRKFELDEDSEYLDYTVQAALEMWLAAKRATDKDAVRDVVLLAEEHRGMRVDYSGMLKQCRGGLRREPALAEMLRQLQDHLTELGSRWYAGDMAAVDEILQLYCIEGEARKAVLQSTPPNTVEAT